MKDLLNKKCVPCEGGTLPFTNEQIEEYKKEIAQNWQVINEGKKLYRKFKLENFKKAMVLVNEIAKISEQEQHHPDIKIFYNIVEITLWTHAIAGLSENDFVVAAKIDALVQ